MHANEKASEAHAKYAEVGLASEVSRKNREAVDIFGKKWTYQAPPPVIAFLLTAPPFDKLIKSDQ